MPCGDASWGSGMSILIQQTLQAIFGQPYLLVERSDDLLQRAYRLEVSFGRDVFAPGTINGNVEFVVSLQ